MCPPEKRSGANHPGPIQAGPGSAEAPRVGPSGVDGTSKEIPLPKSLSNLVNGLRAGHGITSQPSLSMSGGARPDLVPMVVCVTRGGGFTTFLTVLATLYALKEESTGDVILMHSYSLDAGALTSLLEASPKDGRSDEIRFEISMRAPGPDGTFPST